MDLKVKKLHPDAKLPTKNYESDACFDLYSVEDIIIDPGEIVIISTGIAIEIPNSYVGFIWDRSGLGSKGIHRLAGVIDCDYRGEVKIVLANVNIMDFIENEQSYYYRYKIDNGDKIAQLFIQKVEPFKIVEVKKLSETERGKKGWGSSGR